MSEVRLAFKLAWVTATVITFATVLAPCVLSGDQIARITPRCERKAVCGQDCFFCGMTTGFIDIAHGRFEQARNANRAAIPLYGGFLFNGIGLPLALLRTHRRKKS